jgi:glycosyltransferase involved in cell wall biosynthesis
VKRVRVVLLASSYPRSAQDTAGAFLVPLVRALDAQGLDVHVVAPRGPDVDGAPGGVPVHHVPYARVQDEHLYYGAGAPAALRTLGARAVPLAVSSVAALAWTARQLRPDVIYAHWMVPCGLAAAITGIPTVAYAHGSDVAWMERLGPLASALSRRWHALAAPSPGLAQQASAACNTNVVVVPLPVEPMEPRHPGAVTHPVGYLGRLLPQKGVDVLLRAAARLGVRVLVAGDGPDRPRLEAVTQQLGVDATFLGWVPPEKRAAAFARMGVVVVPSVASEGAPSVVAEAGALGIPVAGSAVPGVVDLLGTVWCAPPGDAAALAALLDALLHDDTLRQRARAHAQAVAAARHPEVVGPAHAALLRAAALSR